MGDDMILCFDIGGSRIKAGLVPAGDSSGVVRPLGDAPTPTADFPSFLAALAGFARGHALRGVAISIAGVVEPETGVIHVANIPVPMASHWRRKSRRPWAFRWSS